MKRFISSLLALMMLLSLAACTEGGLSLDPSGKSNPNGDSSNAEDGLILPDDDGVALGYAGDTLRTAFFDMTINDPYTCAEFDGLTPKEGYKFLVAELTLYNHSNFTQPMFDTDFEVVWDLDDEDAWDFPVCDEAMGPDGETVYSVRSEQQVPVDFKLGIHKTYTGVLLYEVPENSTDYFINFYEVFDDGSDGDAFYVRFSE